MHKVPKRGFIVLVLVFLGMKLSSKNVTKVIKRVREQNSLQSEQKMLQSEQKMFATKLRCKSNKKCYKGNRKCSGKKIAPNGIESREKSSNKALRSCQIQKPLDQISPRWTN